MASTLLKNREITIINRLIGIEPIQVSPLMVTQLAKDSKYCQSSIQLGISRLQALGIIEPIRGYKVNADKLQELLN